MEQINQKSKKIKIVLIAIIIAIFAVVSGYGVVGLIRQIFIQPAII
ncbi:MAG: hypothetical protein WA055_00370 [Candidatus Moraniibacteriota bacterium]